MIEELARNWPAEEQPSIHKVQGRYLLCLGDIIDAHERTACRLIYPLEWQPSGSIGFLEFVVQKGQPHFAVHAIGVEERYQGRGIGDRFLAWAEDAALALQLPTVGVIGVGNPFLAKLLRRRGYAMTCWYDDTWAKSMDGRPLKTETRT